MNCHSNTDHKQHESCKPWLLLDHCKCAFPRSYLAVWYPDALSCQSSHWHLTGGQKNIFKLFQTVSTYTVILTHFLEREHLLSDLYEIEVYIPTLRIKIPCFQNQQVCCLQQTITFVRYITVKKPTAVY